jgi:succinoglycan biosynthesis transport protein ExoP
MNIGQILNILRARWLSATLVLIGVVGLVAAVTLTRTEEYTATASVLVDVKAPDVFGSAPMLSSSLSGYMATQLDVMRSEPVALRALRQLGLHEDPIRREAWQSVTEGRGSFESWLAASVGRDLTVTPSRDSNVINVEYVSRDAKFAADIANAIVQAYIDITLDLRIEPARLYNSFFDERAQQARAGLEKAQAQLSEYQQRKGIIATDERMDIENARLSELSTQLVALQAIAAESTGRQGQVRANADRMQEVLSNALVAGLTSEVSRTEARLTELNLRLGDQHPQVREMRANLEQQRARLASETRRVASSLQVTDNVNQSRVAVLRASLEAQRTRVLQLKGQRDEAAVLLRDVESATRVYDAALARVDQTAMQSQNTQTNVSRLKTATEPPFPSSPRVMLSIAAALVVGTLLAVGTALTREMLDRRLRTEDDIHEGLQLPMLITLPGPTRSDPRTLSRLVGGKSRLSRSLASTPA